MPAKKRIFIGIPCYESVAAQTLEDYMRFAYHLGRRMLKYDFFLGVKPKSEQFRARNSLVEAAQDINADWFLMLDDDHIIDIKEDSGKPGEGTVCYDFLKKLLAHKVDIVGPLYYQRGGEARPVLMKEVEGAYYYLSESEIKKGLQEVAVQGGGCMLIRMPIFDKIKQPYFEPEFKYGTDIQLCKSAREKGFKVYSDTSVEIGHVYNRRVIVTSENKDAFAEEAMEREAINMIAGWQANSMLNLYKADAMEYMGIKTDDELNRLYEQYGFMGEALVQKYGEASEEYYRNLGRPQLARQVLYHFNEDMKAYASFILHTIKTNVHGRGLDYGCGSAPIGFDLAKRGHVIYFHDINGSYAYEFLKWRAKKYGIYGESAFFQEWPDANSLNYALFLDSIEHLRNWQAPILMAKDALKNYGFLITNFMSMNDKQNPEHIFQARGDFMKFMVENDFYVVNTDMFQKRVSA